MKRLVILKHYIWAAIGGFCQGPLSANGEDVYPAGHSITSNYQLSDSLLPLSDTLIISRSIVNSESFDLTGLYFSDNFPPAATIIDNNLEVVVGRP